MTDLRKISGSPLEISGDATMEQLRDAINLIESEIDAMGKILVEH